MNAFSIRSVSLFLAGSLMTASLTAQEAARASLEAAITSDGVRLEASALGGIDASAPVWAAIIGSTTDRTAMPLRGLEVLAEPTVLASGPLEQGRLILDARAPEPGKYFLQAVILNADLSFTVSDVAMLDLRQEKPVLQYDRAVPQPADAGSSDAAAEERRRPDADAEGSIPKSDDARRPIGRR
jgi:hypothetical protein